MYIRAPPLTFLHAPNLPQYMRWWFWSASSSHFLIGYSGQTPAGCAFSYGAMFYVGWNKPQGYSWGVRHSLKSRTLLLMSLMKSWNITRYLEISRNLLKSYAKSLLSEILGVYVFCACAPRSARVLWDMYIYTNLHHAVLLVGFNTYILFEVIFHDK